VLGHNLKFVGRGWTADDLFETTSTAAHRDTTVTGTTAGTATAASNKGAGAMPLYSVTCFKKHD
jgi:hypothetical protein